MLAFEPADAVTIDLSVQGDGVSVDASELVFETSSWDTAQAVTVSAAEDDDTANGTATISHAVRAGGAADYTSVTIHNVSVSVADNDTARETARPVPPGGGGGGGGGGDPDDDQTDLVAVDYFDDDDKSAYEDVINRLAAAGIAVGCGAEQSCPDEHVTKG